MAGHSGFVTDSTLGVTSHSGPIDTLGKPHVSVVYINSVSTTVTIEVSEDGVDWFQVATSTGLTGHLEYVTGFAFARWTNSAAGTGKIHIGAN